MDRKVLIVEDEPLIADDLEFHLNDMGINNIEVALQYNEALNKLSNNSFDLALLDVNLSGDKDGIQLANTINTSHQVPFIFVTSYYDNGTLSRAKRTNPYGYILKPFDKKEIQINVEMAFHKIGLNMTAKPEKFFIKDKDGMVPISPEDICYVEAFDNYAKVFTTDHSYIISHTLKSIEAKLVPFGFERVHKSYLINLSHITRISDGYVFFGETNLPIGRAYKNVFMSKLNVL